MTAKQTALSRAEMILKVRTGQMTARAAAVTLGVSRKTYYEWERKGLKAMLEKLQDEKPGRPSSQEPPQVEALKEEVRTLTTKLEEMAQTAELRLMLRLLERRDAKKKPKKSPRSSP